MIDFVPSPPSVNDTSQVTPMRQTTQYVIQQIAQSPMNNHLSRMFLVHVSASTRSSSGRHIQKHASRANSNLSSKSKVKINSDVYNINTTQKFNFHQLLSNLS